VRRFFLVKNSFVISVMFTYTFAYTELS